MERYCGDIQRNIRSRRFPFKSINRYITSHARLDQIKLLYNIDQELSFKPMVALPHYQFSLDTCKPSDNNITSSN